MTNYFDGETVHIDEPEPKQVERVAEDYDLVGAFRRDLRQVDASSLTPKETAALVIKAKAGDVACRERLILSLTGLGFHFCKKFGKRLPQEDILSTVNEVIVSSIDYAIKTYDSEQAGGFLNFVYGICNRTLAHTVAEQQSVVRQPSDAYMYKKRLEAGKAIEAAEQAGDWERAEKLRGAPQAKTVGLRTQARLNALHGSDRSLNEEVFEKNGTEPLLLVDTIPDPSSVNHEHAIGLHEGREHLHALFRTILTPGEYEVIERLYLDTDPMTTPEVDRVLRLKRGTAKYVAQVARRKLKAVPDLQEFLKLHATPARFVGKQNVQTLPLNAFPSEVKRRTSAHMKKLTDEQVVQARQLRSSGMSNKALANRFNVCESAMSQAINRKTFKQVKATVYVVARDSLGGSCVRSEQH